jgi:glutathione S-transferase
MNSANLLVCARGRLRYAGKIGKLYPEDAMQAMKVDEIIGLQEDLSAKLGVTIYVGMRPETYGYPKDWPEEEKKATQKKLREAMCVEDGDLCKMLGMFEGKLAKMGTGFFVGDSPTIADCAFLPVCRQLRSGRHTKFHRSIVARGIIVARGTITAPRVSPKCLITFISSPHLEQLVKFTSFVTLLCAAVTPLPYALTGRLDHLPTDILDKYPAICEFEKKMMAIPAIKTHYGA